MWPKLIRSRAFIIAILVLFGMKMEAGGMPLDREVRSADEDIIAGVDFLSVFIRNAEERYYPYESESTKQYYYEDKQLSVEVTTPSLIQMTRRLPKFKLTTTTTARTPENHLLTSEASSNVDLKTVPPPITNSEVYKYIKSKSSGKGNSEDKYYKKEDSFTELISTTVEEVTENMRQANLNTLPVVEPIVANSKKEDLTVEEEDPLTIEATEINEEVVAKVKVDGADSVLLNDGQQEEHPRTNREDQSTYQFNINRNRNNQNKGRSISYSTVIQVHPGQESQKQWHQDHTNQQGITKTNEYADQDTKEKKFGEATAETKDYYVTRKFTQDDYNESYENKKWIQQNNDPYHSTEKNWGTTEKIWGTTEKNWGIQQKTYSEVNKIYQTTEKNWGVQQKPYSEPGQIYQTTEKNWGIPEKTYARQEKNYNNPRYSQPEQNYEVDEQVSVLTNGRAHGIQNQKSVEEPIHITVGNKPEKPNDNQKVGYVVEGRNFKKYRVEERTSDGFIVGEYGVVSNNDGSLRGVRYTADGTINPSVIYNALMKFLAL